MAKPFLRWVGGKQKLLPQLLPLLPVDVKERRYIEPFLGGGALFFHLEPAKAMLADTNLDLLQTYVGVANPFRFAHILNQLKDLERDFCEFQYYKIRTAFNKFESLGIDIAALFIYLNRTCFNGVWRVNRNGEFNVPIGKFASGPNIVNEEVLQAAHTVLQRKEIAAGDFEAVLLLARCGDFVYMDPPYVPVSSTSNFTAYTKDGFSNADQKILAKVFRDLDKRGCKLMLSNSNSPVVRDLYSGFDITEIEATRSINSNTTARGVVTELVVRNYT